MITFGAAAILLALFIVTLRSRRLSQAAAAPVAMIALGAAGSFAWRAGGGPFLSSDWLAAGADALLGAIAFAAAAQFRVSQLAKTCPASFRLTLGGAPLFLILCTLCAYILLPQLTLPAAALLAGVLALNGAAFDRRAVSSAPAPAAIKGAVRLESAAVLALGVPVVVILEGLANVPTAGAPLISPLYEATRSLFVGFAIGGSFGLISAYSAKQLNNNRNIVLLAGAYAVMAFLLAPVFGGHAVVAAAAAGLLWGEETRAVATTRVKIRRVTERFAAPLAYLAFGAIAGPRMLQADLLSVLFAIAAVSAMRAGPRFVVLQRTRMPSEARAFLAWFGGAPGAASALFLISLCDAPSIVAQDTIMTVGAVAILAGVIAARVTSQPLLKMFLKRDALARRRARLAGEAGLGLAGNA